VRDGGGREGGREGEWGIWVRVDYINFDGEEGGREGGKEEKDFASTVEAVTTWSESREEGREGGREGGSLCCDGLGVPRSFMIYLCVFCVLCFLVSVFVW